MFDDFLDPVGEFRAYLDYTQSFKVYPKLISIVKYKGYIDKAAFLLWSFIKMVRCSNWGQIIGKLNVLAISSN